MELRISAKPSVLAVIIGVIELILSELFKLTADCASAWHRRKQLYHNGRFRVRANPYLQQRHTYLTTGLLFVLLVLTIVLELSIDSAAFPSSSRVPIDQGVRCFGPTRDTRYFNKRGPRNSELDDDRVASYIKQAGCGQGMLDLSVQGAAALETGYPGCLPGFASREFDEVLGIQGGAVGFVGNSEAGDPHLDYGVERDGEIVSPDVGDMLAGTSFWLLSIWGLGKSVAFWSFGGGRVEERVGTNLAIPKRFIDDTPKVFRAESTANVTCTSNARECYDMVRPKALSVDPVVRSYRENTLAVVISSLKNHDSSLCIFDSSMDMQVSWIYLNLFIPDVERDGRNGPAIVRLRIRGRARCMSKLPRQSSRMYLDAMERVVLNETLNTTDTASFDSARDVLQRAAVIIGMKTLPEEGVPCQPLAVMEGSTVGAAELIVTAVFSALLLLFVVALFAMTIAAQRSCPVRVDPLNPLWPVQLLVAETREREEDNLRAGSDGPPDVSMGGTAQRRVRALRRHTRSLQLSSADDLWVGLEDEGGVTHLTAHSSDDGGHRVQYGSRKT
ncbi:hypothetical protein BWQ96_09675 [Gracilariopsis chorda]|uniref:Uncharacterized protein n=1 Tax=Gracilariopsis chorda TaxID=448386 RepID=A0A2V3IEY1_9FLOR|nr:hypothetical protein BWQ96_09675 [Gracilariopsis chorda]|eukprot:PXF40612.1 hypothetical protein BWQ96_09675 [Gracilariopsis chorda]